MVRNLVVIAILCAVIGSNVAHEEEYAAGFANQFMVYELFGNPSGIIVWIDYSPLIHMFGIKLHVVQQNHTHGQPVLDRKLEANTTRTMDGKFMIIDHDMVIKEGEHIEYRYSVLYKGTLHYSNYHISLVTKYFFYTRRDTNCHSGCTSGEWALREETRPEKTILEDESDTMNILVCLGSEAAGHLFFPFANATTYVTDAQLFVKSRLWEIESLRPLVNNVATTYLSQDGVGVRMTSVMDKLKVLELGKGKLDVFDCDALRQESGATNIEASN